MASPNPGRLELTSTSGDISFKPAIVPVQLSPEVVAFEVDDCNEITALAGELHIELKVDNSEIELQQVQQQGAAGAPGVPGAVTIPAGTASVVAGRMVYADSNGHVAHTDARSLPQALALGAIAGISGIITALGTVQGMTFSDASPVPVVGQRVFLARADDEPANGAAGKVTVAVLTLGFLAPIGMVVRVESDFNSTRVADVAVRVLDVFGRPA